MHPLLGALIRRFVTILMRVLESAVVTSIAPRRTLCGFGICPRYIVERLGQVLIQFCYLPVFNIMARNVRLKIPSRDEPRRIFTESEREDGLVMIVCRGCLALEIFTLALTSCRPDLDATPASPGPEAVTHRSLQPPATAPPVRSLQGSTGQDNTTPGCLTSMLTASAIFAC